jgi:hypothetical protein
MLEKFLVAAQLAASQEGLSSMELVLVTFYIIRCALSLYPTTTEALFLQGKVDRA